MKKVILFYITIFLVILCTSMAVNNFDYDLWARLIAGMGVLDGHNVLKSDFLSYTPVHTWYDHEWGAGVIFYFFLKYFGGYSLIFLQAALVFGILFTASRIIKLRSVKSPYNIIFYLATFMALVPTLNIPIRCHLFSFLFFTVFLYILEHSRKGNNKVLYLLPVITLFWNNIHGGIVSGIGLIFIYIIGEILNKKPIKHLVINFILSCIVMFINPWGFEYIKFLLMANTMPRIHISEWWGIFSKFHLKHYLLFKTFMVGIVSVETFTLFAKKEKLHDIYKNCDKVKWILFFVTLYLAITKVKLMPFFAIYSLCFAYEDFYKLIENIKLPAWKDKAIYTILIASTIFTLIVKDYSLPINYQAYPVREVEFIKINNLKGKLLVNFGLGSYASYKLYPHNKIFMDGRYEEVYYDFMVPMLKRFYLGEVGWDDILIEYTPDVMILEQYYPVFDHLANSKDWKLVYKGNIFGVFVNSKDLKSEYKIPEDNLEYYKENLFKTDIDLRKNEK